MFGLRSATEPSPCPTPSPCGSDRPPLGWSSNNSSSSTATSTTVGPPVAEKPRWHHGRRTHGHFIPLDITGAVSKTVALSLFWFIDWIYVCRLQWITELKVQRMRMSRKTSWLSVNSLFPGSFGEAEKSCSACSLKVVEIYCKINVRMLHWGSKMENENMKMGVLWDIYCE